LIVANPAASGFTGAALRAVTNILSRRFAVETEWPTTAQGSREAAESAAASGYEVVAAMGGDGVAHQVAQGLVHTDTALAVLPAGTTNVLARVMGLPKRTTKAAGALVGGEPRLQTVAHVTDGERSNYALFALGIGFDADMVRESDRRPLSKGSIGALHYVRSAVTVAVRDYRRKPPNLRATCDGKTAHAVSVMVQVHGPYTYFGPVALHLTPEVEDGPAAFAAEKLPVHRAAAIVTRSALRRGVAGARGTHVWPGFQKLIIEADPPAALQADGDFLGLGEYFEVTPAPDAIRLLLP